MDNLNDESVILALDLRNVLGFPDTEGDAALTVEDTHQVYRSARGPLEAPPGVEHMDSFDAPVYRSMGPSVAIPAHLDLGIPAHASDDEWDAKGLLHALPCAPGALPLALARGGSAAEVPSLGIPLPADAFDCVLSFLSAHPGERARPSRVAGSQPIPGEREALQALTATRGGSLPRCAPHTPAQTCFRPCA